MEEPVYWTTKNGITINIDYLDESHVRNILKMLIRNNRTKVIRSTFQLNGDIAQHSIEQQIEDDYYDYQTII